MRMFGTSESTTRVALSRMVAGGDLVKDGASYTLSDRLVQRQRDVEPPAFRTWRGTWEMAVVTTTGRSAADRVALRADMARQRVAELREGVWMRPANLRRTWPDSLLDVSTCFEVEPLADSVELAARLWNLPEWSERGHAYLEALARVDDEPTRFVTMVAAVHHLNTDPLLPDELLPDDWPAAELRRIYTGYREWLDEARPTLD